MHLFLLSQEANTRPGAVAGCIVVCRDEEMAPYMHPDSKCVWMPQDNCWGQSMFDHTVPIEDDLWCHPHQVQVEYVGEAAEHLEPGTLMAYRRTS